MRKIFTKFIYTLAFLSACGAMAVTAGPEEVVVLTVPTLNAHSEHDGWILTVRRGQIQADSGPVVEFSPKAQILHHVTRRPPQESDAFDREALFLYIPSHALNLDLIGRLLAQGDPVRYLMRLRGRPTRGNVVKIERPLALAGTVPAGRFFVDPEVYIPYFRFDGELEIDVVEPAPGVLPRDLPSVPLNRLPDRPAERQNNPSATEGAITLLTPIPHIIGVDGEYLLLEINSGEIAWPESPRLEISPRSFVVDEGGGPLGQLSRIQVRVPIGSGALAAALRVLHQPAGSVVERTLALVISGAVVSSNVLPAGLMRDGWGELRTAFPVINDGAPPFMTLDANSSVDVVRYVHADAAANDLVAPRGPGEPTRDEMCAALLRAQRREGVTFLHVIKEDEGK